MATDQPSCFEFEDGAGNEAGTDANAYKLPMRSLEDAILFSAMAKVFPYQKLQEAYGGQAKSRRQHPIDHVTR
ncbi:hypothetical protein [Reyranella soli]|uniref:Uncharacterized protein n=1 Tax=Reyranella soli TaxID=1230389 RepID=A0A512NPT1_9HYPH|nr:hypothetical protein [Reyranella soli]GEP60932.1 hypothetical protein RSO01_80980 [Reyranella soli]